MRTIILLTLTLLSCSLSAQTSFVRTYGGPMSDAGISAQQTTDGGYILMGHTQSYGAGGLDHYLIKTDALGDTLWTRTYGSPQDDFGIWVQQTTDGGYILCGGVKGLQMDSLYLVKTDANGQVEWDRAYSATVDRNVGQFVEQTLDGGYIAVGFNGPGFDEDIYIVKTDPNGDVLWERGYGHPGRDFGTCVRQTSDGRYYVFGETSQTTSSGADLYLLRLDTNGDTLWTRTYGTADNEIGRTFSLTADGGLILIGQEAGQTGDILVYKTDGGGNVQWTQKYGGPDQDTGNFIEQTPDGGYVLGGGTTDSTGGFHLYGAKIDGQGVLLWDTIVRNGLFSEAFTARSTSDGGLMFFGYTNLGLATANTDFFLIKLGDLGIVGKEEDAVTAKVKLFPNPVEDVLNVLVEGRTRPMTIRMIDLQGRVLWETEMKNGCYQWDRQEEPAGVYFIQLTDESRADSGSRSVGIGHYLEARKIILK